MATLMRYIYYRFYDHILRLYQYTVQYSEIIQYNRHTCALPVHVMILVQCVRFIWNAKME